MSRRPSSQQLSRSQMLGMIATLRGAVYSLILTDPSDRDEEVADAKRILDETAGDADEEDLVEGSFDMSWSPRHQEKIEDMRLLWRDRADLLVEEKLDNVEAELRREFAAIIGQHRILDGLLPVFIAAMNRAIKAGFEAGAEFEYDRRGAEAMDDVHDGE